MSWSWIQVVVQTLLFIGLAPLFAGWVKTIKSLLQNRLPPSPIQPYRDLWKLFGKQMVLADNASPIFRITPYIMSGAVMLAASVVPLLAMHLPSAASADLIVLVGFFALARFFQALAGMDVGTAFGGMGSSREMTVSALAEPAMLMSVFTVASVAASTNLSTVIDTITAQGFTLRPSLLFALAGLVFVVIAETARIPVDNPATHLELTMIHEAMILEYSGRMLAMIEWTAQIKLLIYLVLIIDIFLPWGLARDLTPLALTHAGGALLAKLAVLGMALALLETLLAKMRLFRVPQFLTLAFVLGLLGMLSHIILEVP